VDIKERALIQKTFRRHPWETSRFEIICRTISQSGFNFKLEGNVLDLGCGDAFVTANIAKRYPNLRIFGVDNAAGSESIGNIQQKKCYHT